MRQLRKGSRKIGVVKHVAATNAARPLSGAQYFGQRLHERADGHDLAVLGDELEGRRADRARV
jgi:hypothetical protein